MNYEVIKDEKVLSDFINWLPRLGNDECFYGCLFARSKYAKNEDGSNKFPHIKTDKAQLKRFTISKPGDLLHKLRQLEVGLGVYKTKDGLDIPQESLACYLTPNPRNQKMALFDLSKRLLQILQSDGHNYNIHQEALSAIQRSKSRTVYVDFDIDSEDDEGFKRDVEFVKSQINSEACTWLKTRGGAHLLIDPTKVDPNYKNIWYKAIKGLQAVDSDSGNDTMIPIPGTYQGGFTPHFTRF